MNIIPIIAKADTINKSELQKFKSKIMSELINNGVQIYQFPTSDETVAEVNRSMNDHLPFAVVGSSDFVKVGSKMMRARRRRTMRRKTRRTTTMRRRTRTDD